MGRVLVVGAQGTLGRLCATTLREAGHTVFRGGRRVEDADDFRLLDLDRPDTLGSACAEVDLVVTTVRHAEHPLERHVLREGGTLLSVASLSAADRVELKAAESDPRGLVVLHAGVHPGVGTLLLQEMLAAHPEADGLEIAVVFSFLQSSGRAGMVDFLYPALASAPRHPTRPVAFAAPIGRRRCMSVEGMETGFFGGLADDRTARLDLAFLERAAQAELRTLNALRLWTLLPRAFFTFGSGWRSQRPTSTEPRRDVLTVSRAGVPIVSCSLRGAGDYRMTAAATEVFVTAVLTSQTDAYERTGVLGAEELFDLESLRGAFQRGGIEIVYDPVP